jgi:hypothetical protein
MSRPSRRPHVRPPLAAAASSPRDQRLDIRPFVIGQVARISQVIAIVLRPVLVRPHQHDLGRFLGALDSQISFSVTHGWSAFGGADHGGRDIGLEGGVHCHALMTMIAYAFQYRRLKTARRENTIHGPPPQPTLPATRQAIVELIARLPPERCPHCRKWICRGNGLQHRVVIISAPAIQVFSSVCWPMTTRW